MAMGYVARNMAMSASKAQQPGTTMAVKELTLAKFTMKVTERRGIMAFVSISPQIQRFLDKESEDLTEAQYILNELQRFQGKDKEKNYNLYFFRCC